MIVEQKREIGEGVDDSIKSEWKERERRGRKEKYERSLERGEGGDEL